MTITYILKIGYGNVASNSLRLQIGPTAEYYYMVYLEMPMSPSVVGW